MRLLAVAVAGLEVQVAVAALGLHSDRITLGSQALTVLMGVLFLVALVLPSFVQVFLIKREDVAFRRAIGDLVSARESRDVAEAPPPPRLRTRRSLEGRAPGRGRNGPGPVPVVGEGFAPGRLERAGRGRGAADSGAGQGRHQPLAGRAHQLLHAVLRSRGTAEVRRSGRHGRHGHRTLRNGRAGCLPGIARRVDRVGQPHHVHGAAR